MLFSTHVNHVSVSPTNGIGSLCGPNSISRANAHMVYIFLASFYVRHFYIIRLISKFLRLFLFCVDCSP